LHKFIFLHLSFYPYFKEVPMTLPTLPTLQQLTMSVLALSTAALVGCGSGGSSSNTPVVPITATPIQHIVVIFQENVSFDHYFGTYPMAANLPGEPVFTATTSTPVVNNLRTPLDVQNNFIPLSGVNLLTNNPTTRNAANGTNAINPFRLPPSQAFTADQGHDYSSEQRAFNNGAMDLFPASVGNGDSHPGFPPPLDTPGLVMGYFDGNTVTALWNYAQHYALNDNSFGTTFGPSTVGALNLISGQTNGVIATNLAALQNGTNLDHVLNNDGNGGITVTGDPQPLGDACSTRGAVQLGGKNIGDMLNTAGVSWGFFQGGFDLTISNSNGTTGCARSTTSPTTQVTQFDYIPHHQPFQYYASTSNLQHLRPSSVAAIGRTFQSDGVTKDPANHQYDIHDFFDAVSAGNFPAVSFLKAPGYQDAHAGYSSPLDEQTFVTNVINFLQTQPGWKNTMVVIAYDDSDGWYDHQASPIVNPSTAQEGPTLASSANFISNGLLVLGNGDFLNGVGACQVGMNQGRLTPTIALAGANGQLNAQGRCGYGPRLPLIVVSPYAKQNYVDHTLTDQTSIMRFIEDNWLGGQRITGSFDSIAGPLTNMLDFKNAPRKTVLMLDPVTGEPL
jgi:phospholipase C